MKIYDKDGYVDVSYYDENGYWTHNGKEYTSEGTGLPPECTDIIHNKNLNQPSSNKIAFYNGKTAKFDKKTETWTTVDTHIGVEFWDYEGNKFIVDRHIESLPSKAILDPPPKVKKNKIVRYINGKWEEAENNLGKTYYNSDGFEGIVQEFGFKLNDNQTFTKKPISTKAGYEYRIEKGKWVLKKHHKSIVVYDKQTLDEMTLTNHYGELNDNLTTLEPPSSYYSFVNDKWEYDKEKERPDKTISEKNWVKEELEDLRHKLVDELISRQFLQAEILKKDEVLNLIKYKTDLNAYLLDPEFPFGVRPTLKSCP